MLIKVMMMIMMMTYLYSLIWQYPPPPPRMRSLAPVTQAMPYSCSYEPIVFNVCLGSEYSRVGNRHIPNVDTAIETSKG